MQKKKICVVTGTRAEYGPLKLLLEKIISSNKLDLLLLVTGMHLLKKYGNTIELIRKDGFPIAKIIPMYEENNTSKESLGKAVGKAIINFTTTFREIQPDLLIVAGDRFESLAAVISASTLLIPIAHIQGGDSVETGQVDEQIRHSITKFSHIHFPATSKSAERLKLMGEEEWRIYTVGAIALDMIFNETLLSRKQIYEKLGLNFSEKLIICIQHPNTMNPDLAGNQMKLTLQILKDYKLQTVIIYPNNDPGSELIINEIENHKNIVNFYIFRDLERIEFLSLLKNANLLIGNSSSGLIESPVFKISVVNIGDRNKGRESGDNVISVSHNYTEIKNAIDKGLSEEFRKECQSVINTYGEGNALNRIVEILEKIEINDKLLRKKLTY